MKKYAVNRLTIEIGRWCNMTCRHCYKGERERLAFNPDYIDKFLDNIYLVNHLYFCGGEATFYIDEMVQILEIFKKKNVPINHLRVNSNILVKSEKFVEFLNNAKSYPTCPKIKLLISKDRFHFDNMVEMGIDKKQYEETKNWYRKRLSSNIILKENSGSHWKLLLEGKAKGIPQKELSNLLLLDIDYDKMKRTFITDKEITDKDCKMENAFESIDISAEGYMFFDSNLSYKSQRKKNHELSLGHVYADTLENHIKNWNSHCDNEEIYYNDRTQKDVGFYRYQTRCTEITEEIKKAVDTSDEENLLVLREELEDLRDSYKEELTIFTHDENFIDANQIIYQVLNQIFGNLDLIDILSKFPNGFFRKMALTIVLVSLELNKK